MPPCMHQSPSRAHYANAQVPHLIFGQLGLIRGCRHFHGFDQMSSCHPANSLLPSLPRFWQQLYLDKVPVASLHQEVPSSCAHVRKAMTVELVKQQNGALFSLFSSLSVLYLHGMKFKVELHYQQTLAKHTTFLFKHQDNVAAAATDT